MPGRRCKIVRTNSNFLGHFFADGPKSYEVTNGIPGDARVVNVVMDFATGNVLLLIESETFPEVAEGMQYPYAPDIVITTTDTPGGPPRSDS